jgi:hypothetical protein
VPIVSASEESTFLSCGRASDLPTTGNDDVGSCLHLSQAHGIGAEPKPPSPPPKRGRTNKTLGPRPPSVHGSTALGLDHGDSDSRWGSSAAASRVRAEPAPPDGCSGAASACASPPSHSKPFQAGSHGPQAFSKGREAGAGPPDADEEMCGHVGDCGPRTGRRRLVPDRWAEGGAACVSDSDSDDDMEDAEGEAAGMGGKRPWRGAAAGEGGGHSVGF